MRGQWLCHAYRDNRASMMVLDSHGDIMVTAEMNGCTFGIGSAAPGSGTRMVMHSNARKLSTSPTRRGQAAQNKQQDADVFGALGGNAAILRPDDYHQVDNKRDIDTPATIIGIPAATGDWSMYAQICNVSMLGRAMIEVKKIC